MKKYVQLFIWYNKPKSLDDSDKGNDVNFRFSDIRDLL